MIHKHTPGPWRIDCLSDDERPGICCDSTPSCLVVIAFKDETHDTSGIWGKDREQELANARLMAAAPQLLNALEYLVAEYEDRKSQFGSDYLWQRHEDTDVLTEAQAAITAATQPTI